MERRRGLLRSSGLYLSSGDQTPEAEAGGGKHLKSFCWITLLLTATNGH